MRIFLAIMMSFSLLSFYGVVNAGEPDLTESNKNVSADSEEGSQTGIEEGLTPDVKNYLIFLMNLVLHDAEVAREIAGKACQREY